LDIPFNHESNLIAAFMYSCPNKKIPFTSHALHLSYIGANILRGMISTFVFQNFYFELIGIKQEKDKELIHEDDVRKIQNNFRKNTIQILTEKFKLKELVISNDPLDKEMSQLYLVDSLVGALYVDGGMKSVAMFMQKHVVPEILEY